MAERHAAIHAARTLRTNLLVGEILIDLEPVVDSLDDGPACWCFAGVLQEAGGLTHAPPPAAGPQAEGREPAGTAPFAWHPALVCTRAETLSRISAASGASAPVSTSRADWRWLPHV